MKIPDTIYIQCLQINEIKKLIRSFEIRPLLKVKYDPICHPHILLQHLVKNKFTTKEELPEFVNTQYTIWKRSSRSFVKKIIKENTPNLRLQIKYQPYFVSNYHNKLRRVNKFTYKSAPIQKDKIIIPEQIQLKCIQVSKIKSYLKFPYDHSQNMIKYEPFENLESLRENMLFVIRENYIGREEIINLAYKQYKFWSNLAIENIREIIKDNIPSVNKIALPKNAISIQENFHNYFLFKDPENYMEFEYPLGELHLRIEAEFHNESEEFKVELKRAASWMTVMPIFWMDMEKENNLWVTRMKYFYKHRRPSPRYIYNVEKYLLEINHIKEKKDIKIVRKMKKWETIRAIGTFRVLHANIENPTLFEEYNKKPALLEYHEQIEKFLQHVEIDDIPCVASNWIESPKDRRLRLPKVHQISLIVNGERTNKILTPAALQIFFNMHNTFKPINESYQKDWEFNDLFSKSKDQIWRIRETIILYNFREYQCPQIDTNEIDLRLNDAKYIDDYIDIPAAITIFR
jgi:hypothetical protein